MWNPGWDNLFSRVAWGRYPGEELIRFVARNFYSAQDRGAVRVLELGCGTGANLWYLAREGFSAHGVDGSRVALGQASARLRSEGLSARCYLSDAMALPFADETFDAVIDVECLYANTLADTAVILSEAHRVLKPAGRLYSKTFCTGMAGEETGERMAAEPNTFLRMPDGPLHQDYGLIRLTAEDEIPQIYRLFANLQWDTIWRSHLNRTTRIGEWVIHGRKGLPPDDAGGPQRGRGTECQPEK